MTIESNIANLIQTIRDYENQYSRPPHSVSLLAVTKTQGVESIREAIQAGQREFGENYLQEALPKIDALVAEDLVWHFIGPIQSNKTKKIAEHFSWVQSVSDRFIAQRLNDQRPPHLPPLNICIQVNISQETSKSGVDPIDLEALADYCDTLPNLRLRGLMTIPAPKESFIEQKDALRQLRTLFDKLSKKHALVDTLSMGMSDDLAAAIAEGSTMVRIGTKIFGKRE